MNELQKVTDYNINKFQSDPLVNTITTLVNALIDTNKTTIYPVVNIDYRGGEVLEDVINFSYHIKALDQDDLPKGNADSKLQTDTNRNDVLNETFNICQSYINSFRQYNNLNIEIVSRSIVTPLKGVNLNGLSGHEFDIVLSIPNEGSACPEN